MFDFLPFGNESSDENDTSDGVVRSNADRWGIDVTVQRGDPSGVLDARWFESRTVSLEQEHAAADSPSATASTGDSTTAIPPAAAEPPDTAPIARELETDGLALPHEPNFVRGIELAAKNGAYDPTETVYVLTGSTEHVPNVLFGIDDPLAFEDHSESSVTVFAPTVARTVAEAYAETTSPDLVLWVHTHPFGAVRPSAADQTDPESIRRAFEAQLDGEFRFLQGIHAFRRRDETPGLSDRHRLATCTDRFVWRGERYDHRLGVWDQHFDVGIEPAVIDDA